MTLLENLMTIRKMSDYFYYDDEKKANKHKRTIETMIRKIQKGDTESLFEEKNG